MMWIVQLETDAGSPYCYGPFEDETIAEWFAAFVADEIDPAVVISLHSPLTEMLAWHRTMKLRDSKGGNAP